MNLKELFLGFFIPTATESYKKKHELYRKEYEPSIRAMEVDLESLEFYITERRQTTSAMVARIEHTSKNPAPSSSGSHAQSDHGFRQLPSRSNSWDSESACTVFGPTNAPAQYFNTSHQEDNIVEGLRESIEDVQVLQSYAEELQKSIDDRRFLVDTQATADLTGYRELRDWAKTMLHAYEYLTTVLINISTVGASLVYATIFSASRGNIGYMCLTFPLFTFAFVVSVVTQISLRWAASLPTPVPFASQTIWKYIVSISLGFAALSVLSALAVLNVTIFCLDPGSSSVSLDTVGGVTKGIVFIPGIAVFAASGLGFLIFCGAVAISILAGQRSCWAQWNDPLKGKNTLFIEGSKHV